MLNATEFELDYNRALEHIRTGGFSGKRCGYEILYKITLDEVHKDRLEAASYITEKLEVDFDSAYLDEAWNKRHDTNKKPETALALIKDNARVALHAIAENDPNPWKQQRAASVLYKKYYSHKDSELQSLNTKPLRVIVRNTRHPEQCEAAIAMLDVNKILYGSNTEEDVRLALSELAGITGRIGHQDRFKAAMALWDVWNFGLKEERRSLTQHFIPVFVDIAQDLNDSNGFVAASNLLHLYKHGQNVNEAHKSIALEGLRRTIRSNPLDPNQDNAAMYLGNTVIVSEYNRVGESKVRLAADLSLSYGVLYVSAEDERNPNQLSVLCWLCRNAPQDFRDTFYGILKELAERDIADIIDGHLVQKIREAGVLLRKINSPAIEE
ncbi:MAG: hypothetical protein K2Q34_02535 [Alphaproteobacteria bacterium]|nr:hypothetical protein [Alphaproteobacteria bacterium]